VTPFPHSTPRDKLLPDLDDRISEKKASLDTKSSVKARKTVRKTVKHPNGKTSADRIKVKGA